VPVKIARFAWLVFVCAVVAACAKPVSVRIDASGLPSAQLEYKRIDGAEGTSTPRSCDTPCSIAFEPDSVHELELRADGYHRARFALEYQTVFAFERRSDAPEPTVVVPLLERAH